MEISRKEKFSAKKKATKKWPKIVLASTLALGVGSTSAFAAKPELADYLYNQIVSFTYKPEIDQALQDEEKSLLKNLSTSIASIFSGAKQELEDEKQKIITNKKTEIQSHYNSEMAEVTKKKEEAMTKKKQEMNDAATKSTTEIKANITNEIEKEIEKNKNTK
ncbi:hypothetical protein QUF49_02320 [Fictibacillus sp. b24]|uniref:hypothetical protein n=1 Tax=Fictibacillus sp. b24 TaxID=3055863 RepID=UPI0025A088B5|nr:hypothetical protein [Fictibacillus sp. b24]MDM5314809.1 hypothetical protein [Fictibacillus sp. b24]